MGGVDTLYVQLPGQSCSRPCALGREDRQVSTSGCIPGMSDIASVALRIARVNAAVLQVLIKVQIDEQEAAVAAAQAQPGETVWQLSSPDILPAAGMPAGTALTSEQVSQGLTDQHGSCCVTVCISVVSSDSLWR